MAYVYHLRERRREEEEERREEEETPPGDPFWRRTLFFKGGLKKALETHGETGGPLLLALEDDSDVCANFAKHVWGDGGVQRILRRQGKATFPLIACRFDVTKDDDGAFAMQMVNGNATTAVRSPILMLIRHGSVRAFSAREIAERCGGDRTAVRKARRDVRTLIGRFLGHTKRTSSSTLGRVSNVSATLIARQRKRAKELVLLRGDWAVAKLVRDGKLDARDIVPDVRVRQMATRSTTSVPPAREHKTEDQESKRDDGRGNATTTADDRDDDERLTRAVQPTAPASLRDQQDAEFEASLAADRAKRARLEQEREDADLQAAMEMSLELERKKALERKKKSLPKEPVDEKVDGAVAVVFKLPGTQERLQRRFLETNRVEDLFNFVDVELATRESAVRRYSMNLSFPRRTFRRDAADTTDKTLAEVGLTGRVALFVHDSES